MTYVPDYGPVADFGPLVINTDIDEDFIATLRLWLPTYLHKIEQERGQSIGRWKRPVTYSSSLDDDEFPDRTLPAVFVTSANTTGDPITGDENKYYAAWNVVVSCIVRGRSPKETRENAAIFEGCVRRVVVQQGMKLKGEVRWAGSNIGPVADPSGAGRYIAAGICRFVAYVDDVVQEGVGPFIPDPPGGPYVPPDPGDNEGPYEDPVPVNRVTFDVDGRPPNHTLGE